jgi:hypothetical protein
MLVRRQRRGEPLGVLPGRKVNALEQLRRQHDLRAAFGRLAHEAFRLGDVLAQIVAV